MKIIVHAAFAAALVACPSFAAYAQDRDPTSVRIHLSDLDIASSSGRAQLESRLDSAIRRACSATRSDSRMLYHDARCHAEMMRDAQTQLAQIDLRTATRLASR